MSEEIIANMAQMLAAVLVGTGPAFAALRERIKKDVHQELEPMRAQLEQLNGRLLLVEHRAQANADALRESAHVLA